MDWTLDSGQWRARSRESAYPRYNTFLSFLILDQTKK